MSASKENSSSNVRPERFELLLDVNNAVVSNLELKDLIENLDDCLHKFIEYDYAVLYIYESETNGLREHRLSDEGAVKLLEKGLLIPIEGSLSGQAFTERRAVIADLDRIRQLSPEMVEILDGLGIQSICAVPLVSGEQAFGALTFLSVNDNNFAALDLTLLEKAVGQITIAVVNALNYRRAEHEIERFAMLLDVSKALSAMLGLGEVLDIVSAILRNHLSFDFAGVALYDERDNENLRILALENRPPDFLEGATTIPLDGTPDGLAFRTQQLVRRDRVDLDEFRSPHMLSVRDIGIRSFCCAPLVSRGRAIGVLAVATMTENSLSEQDGETIQLIANQIAGSVESAVQYGEIEKLKNQLAGEKLYLEEEIQSEYNFAEIVGQSAALKHVLRQIETVAPTDSCVLLYGETGTGKELFSRAIHNLSGRRDRTLVKLNCAAIPTGLLESELFGHEKGAFTGAVAPRIGRFELAHRGTLLLDEIGDIPLELQPKLLRVLQESEFERLGSSRTVKTDVRLIAATNCDLKQMVEDKTFRSDLYYRLNVFPIEIPPLRERREDIPLLAGYFTQKHARRMSKRIESIPRESIETLAAYDFPGNVRELENFIERAVILTRGSELDMPLSELQHFRRPVTDDGLPVSHSLEDVERNHIAEVLKNANGRIAGSGGAAEILGMPVSTLRHRMKKLGLL